MADGPTIAVLGAGMGGLATAAALRKLGFRARVYEQAARFARVGAGIQMSPNAMRVLRGLGLEDRIRATAFRPTSWRNREWDTGAMKFELPLGDAAEERYGAPYLLMHRGDLHAALASLVPPDEIALDRKLVDLDRQGDRVVLRFADGSRAEADALVAADGVHSRVRELLLGDEKPDFIGRVAYRTVFPASRLGGLEIDPCTKWWGPDRHIVVYFVTPGREELYFVTSVPEPGWNLESWSATGDLGQLRAAFEGFHPHVQAILAACPAVHKWAIAERKPLARWGEGRVVLLGDACHPMTPYMAQGAAMSMEDGVVLARCLAAAGGDAPAAFRRYEATRKARTSRVQESSHMNTWMRQATDPGWVYGLDPWTAPLAGDPEDQPLRREAS